MAIVGQGTNVTELKAATGALVRVLRGGHYAFDCPDALAVTGHDLWVANCESNSSSGNGTLTEVNSTTGALVRVLSAATYGFQSPDGLVSSGPDLWVASSSSTAVPAPSLRSTPRRARSCGSWQVRPSTSVARSTSLSLARTFGWGSNCECGRHHTGQRHNRSARPSCQRLKLRLRRPAVPRRLGKDLWVGNSGGSSLTEITGTTGTLVRVVKGAKYDFNGPGPLALSNNKLWIGSGGNEVTEINSATGALVRVLNSRKYDFSTPNGFAFSGNDLWVASSGNFGSDSGSLHGAQRRDRLACASCSLAQEDRTPPSMCPRAGTPSYKD